MDFLTMKKGSFQLLHLRNNKKNRSRSGKAGDDGFEVSQNAISLVLFLQTARRHLIAARNTSYRLGKTRNNSGSQVNMLFDEVNMNIFF